MSKLLWAPWRIEYIEKDKEEEQGCIFCEKPKQNKDRENLILLRSDYSFIIMNRYPYNSGHLMIVPYEHKKDFEMLNNDEIIDINNLIRIAIKVLKDVMKPDAFNIGINLGKSAGAGIDEHLHYHIVPRWNGDTNFMPVIFDTRVVPEALFRTYDKLKEKIEKYYESI